MLEQRMPQLNVQGLTSMAAIMENRAHEVGIAVLTPDLNRITMTQIVDNSLYSHTRSFLNLMEVRALIFSQSLVGTPLHTLLQHECKDNNEVDVNKSAFKSAAKGFQSAVKSL